MALEGDMGLSKGYSKLHWSISHLPLVPISTNHGASSVGPCDGGGL